MHGTRVAISQLPWPRPHVLLELLVTACNPTKERSHRSRQVPLTLAQRSSLHTSWRHLHDQRAGAKTLPAGNFLFGRQHQGREPAGTSAAARSVAPWRLPGSE
jgi:hypothetical protein